MGAKRASQDKLFSLYSSGLETRRDAWCYNVSKPELSKNVQQMISFFNHESTRFKASHSALELEKRAEIVGGFISNDSTKIKWSEDLIAGVAKFESREFYGNEIIRSTYRPFTKSWLYSDNSLIWSKYRMPAIFPSDVANLAIFVSGPGAKSSFTSLLISDPVCRDAVEKGYCFPLYVHEKRDAEASVDLFGAKEEVSERARRDGITDAGLKHFQDAYPGEEIKKEDLFYYVYGLLHSEDYRAKYADNLSKQLPRIPRVKTAADFWAFSRAGRELGDLHVNYETVEPYPVTIKQGDLRLADIKNPEAFYRVTKWAFGKAGKEKDKTTVIYNANITMQDIPLEAYDYVVNGKPALEWVMERQVVKVDKDSGIENDANRYAIETMYNPAYPLELFQRVITVSLRTMEIVRGLPKLEAM